MNGWTFLVVVVLANVAMTVLQERRSRRIQYDRFAEYVRTFEDQMRRRPETWRIVSADFKPGWFCGHGRIEWSAEGVEGNAYVEVPIRAPRFKELFGL